LVFTVKPSVTLNYPLNNM